MTHPMVCGRHFYCQQAMLPYDEKNVIEIVLIDVVVAEKVRGKYFWEYF